MLTHERLALVLLVPALVFFATAFVVDLARKVKNDRKHFVDMSNALAAYGSTLFARIFKDLAVGDLADAIRTTAHEFRVILRDPAILDREIEEFVKRFMHSDKGAALIAKIKAESPPAVTAAVSTAQKTLAL